MLETYLLYNALALSPLLLLIDNQKGFRGIYRLLLPLVLGILITFISIRLNVGRDFENYYNFVVNPELFTHKYEYGFRFILEVIHYYELSPQLLFLMMGLLIYIPVFLTYRLHRSVAFLIVWMLLFFLLSLNQLRQVAAMSILLFASCILIYERKYKSYYLLVLTAGSVHVTGYIGLVYPVLSKIKLTYAFYILFALVPVLYLVKTQEVFYEVSQLLNMGSEYGYYLSSQIYNKSQGLYFQTVMPLFLPFAYLYITRHDYGNEVNLIRNSMFIFILLFVLSLNFYILYRLYYLFELLTPLATAFLLRKGQVSRLTVILYILALLLILNRQISQHTINPPFGNAVSPYQTILSDS